MDEITYYVMRAQLSPYSVETLCQVCYEIDRDRDEASMWTFIKTKTITPYSMNIPHCYECGETVIEHAMD